MIAGDIFDKWKVSPKVVNRAITEFGRFEHGVYAIPGNHDLRHHNYTDVKETSYWTLVESETIVDLKPGLPPLETADGPVYLHPFPWGKEIERCPKDRHAGHHVAVIHRYVWSKGTGHVKAPATAFYTEYKKVLKHYDVAIFGDNHKGFLATIPYPQHHVPVINCGGFMARKSDEKGYKPSHAILYAGGSVSWGPTGFQAHWEEDLVKEFVQTEDTENLIEVLNAIGEQTLDFREAMVRYMEDQKFGKRTMKLILEAME